jgi:hypothetical protein
MEIRLRYAAQRMYRYMASADRRRPTERSPILSPRIEMSDKIHSYAELRELIRVSLRAQHPEWVEPNGNSPICDSYEAKFAELLGLTGSPREANTSI